MKKSWKTNLIDIIDGVISGVLIAAAIFGFFSVALFVVFLFNREAEITKWMLVANMLASAMVTFGLLRYLGGEGRRKNGR
jgi:hypothetical protein